MAPYSFTDPLASDLNDHDVDTEKTQPDDDGVDQFDVTRLFPVASLSYDGAHQLNFDSRHDDKTETDNASLENSEEHLRHVGPFDDFRGQNVELCSQDHLGRLPRTDQMK